MNSLLSNDAGCPTNLSLSLSAVCSYSRQSLERKGHDNCKFVGHFSSILSLSTITNVIAKHANSFHFNLDHVTMFHFGNARGCSAGYQITWVQSHDAGDILDKEGNRKRHVGSTSVLLRLTVQARRDLEVQG